MEIQLSDGTTTRIDDKDYWIPKHFTICPNANGYVGAYCSGCQITIPLHKIVCPCDSNLDVDHIDRDKKNNVRTNLRLATRSINVQNSSSRGYYPKGIKVTRHGRYESRINKDGKYIHLGTFGTVKEAGLAYNKAALELYGPSAYTTPIEELKGWNDE